MEKQRSFSFKPTRLLVFSFTISTSVIFFTIFTIWVIKATPSFRQEIHLQYNKSSLSLGLRPITVQSLSSLSGNFSVTGEKDSTLIDSHYSSLENATGFASTSLFSGLQREEDGPGVLVDGESKSDGVDGNLTTLQESTPETISEKIEVPSSQMSEEKSTVATSSDNNGVSIREKVGLKRVKDCDLTKGRWVYDESYPLYTNDSCPFIDEGFNCKGNGRLDKNYMKWRWQPQDCEIPRFNATKMLELIRGKRLVFVGDSINRNQWESMLCMLMGAIKDPKRVYETHRRRITKEKGDYSIKFMDYRCTVEYYATHFLVHEAKARLGHKRIQTLRIDSIDRGTSRWRGADMLVFNTAHWWTHYKTKAGINYYQEGNQVHPRLDVSTAFRRALMTWASWVDRHINPRKTQVFFRSSAPSHFRGGEWNSGGHCMEATQPLNWTPSISYSEKNIIVEEVIKKMKTPVTFLNITNLSGYRIDGHPSIYGGKSGKRSSSNIQDCSHWCLPGVPDTWNEILYFLLQSNRY
ncbi:protein trichome birefringence-like 6 [Quercus suber]|uniref:protein trichome birefringence-like 6 n=1 Tax=Quercus suber TaxID=58331 RepID=UPI0032DF39FF